MGGYAELDYSLLWAYSDLHGAGRDPWLWWIPAFAGRMRGGPVPRVMTTTKTGSWYMGKHIAWLWIVGFWASLAAANAQTPPAPTPVSKYDGIYSWVSAARVNENFRDFNNREHPCGYIRNMGPLIIGKGEAQYYLNNIDQSLSQGTVGPQGELTMRLVATPARKTGWGTGPEITTTGRIDGNGTARARRMSGYCNNDLVWQRAPLPPTGSTQFNGTYALASVTQVNEDDNGSGTNRASQCGNRKPQSLIVTNGQARLPLFEGTVASQGELAMREGPSGDERIINGRIEADGTVRAREIGRGCIYDFMWRRETR